MCFESSYHFILTAIVSVFQLIFAFNTNLLWILMFKINSDNVSCEQAARTRIENCVDQKHKKEESNKFSYSFTARRSKEKFCSTVLHKVNKSYGSLF